MARGLGHRCGLLAHTHKPSLYMGRERLSWWFSFQSVVNQDICLSFPNPLHPGSIGGSSRKGPSGEGSLTCISLEILPLSICALADTFSLGFVWIDFWLVATTCFHLSIYTMPCYTSKLHNVRYKFLVAHDASTSVFVHEGYSY